MGNEKEGMRFEDVRKRVIKFGRDEKSGKIKDYEYSARLKESLINQARLRDGEGAARELRKELRKDYGR